MIPRWLIPLLACPRCRGDLDFHDFAFICSECRQTYPIHHGIPDFRCRPDPYISIANELRKIDSLTSIHGLSFRQMVTHYYQLSPENPPRLHRHYVASLERAVDRGLAFLGKLEKRFGASSQGILLDLGCGTAGMTAAALERDRKVVGVDVALRWLVLGRQRLNDLGMPCPLVCANAEFLPFKPEQFHAVAADSIVEHVESPADMKKEMLRVLRAGGGFFLSTNNRYSLLPEPHVRLWGFGLLPRKWMEPVARLVRKTPYKARLLSRRQLCRLFMPEAEVVLPFFREEEIPLHWRRAYRCWRKVEKFPPFRFLFRDLVPLYFIFGTRGEPGSGMLTPPAADRKLSGILLESERKAMDKSSMPPRPEEPRTEELIVRTFSRLSAVALGLSVGVVVGSVVLLATLFLVWKGGATIGPHLSLLSQFFAGYSVSAAGSAIGWAYGFGVGFSVGWLTAVLRNLGIRTYLMAFKFRADLESVNEYMDRL
ncbi:MAG: methyltransferase domain-containing protein [Acidobacteriota bacterium]